MQGSAITALVGVLSAMIAIGTYIMINGGTPLWDGKALRASFRYEEQDIHAMVDIEGQRLRFEMVLEDRRQKMTLQSTNGLNWTYFVTTNETIDNVSYVFVSECMELTEDAAEYLPLPSVFFPTDGDTSEVTSLRNGTLLQVETDETVVTFDLNHGLFSQGEASIERNDSSGVDLRDFDLSPLDPDAFNLPDMCNGDDPINMAIKQAFHRASEHEMTGSMTETERNLSSMPIGDERRLAPWDHIPFTDYCGAKAEGQGREPQNPIDRCCAFHDFQCGFNEGDLHGSRGASGSAQSWVPGQHQDRNGRWRAEHRSCAGALQHCAAHAFHQSLSVGDWRGVSAAWAVWAGYYWMPCWFNVRFCFPYPCGITWHGRWWFRYPRIRWCFHCWRIPLPTTARWSGYHRYQSCTNTGPVEWAPGQSQRNSNCAVQR